MARQLRGTAPEQVRPVKPKVVVFGPPNVGKTWVSLDFPQVYYVDTEGGASQNQYRAKLAASGGCYFGKDHGSQDFRTVIEEVQTLATVPHDYRTLVIDSFSKLYNLFAAEAEQKVGNDFGKDKKEANKPTRQLLRWVERLDMTVLLVCHAKEKWARAGKELVSEGQTFDGFDKLEYDLDLMLHVTGTKNSQARVHKTRLEGFGRDACFPWSFDEFARRAGPDVVSRRAEAFSAATAEQVKEVRRLVALLKTDEALVARWFAKAGVERWEEMGSGPIGKCIAHLQAQLTQERTEPVGD